MSSPIAPMSHGPLELRQSNIRSEMLTSVVDIFAESGSIVTPIGSVAAGTADPFSDVDVWVTIPDQAAQSVIAERHSHYGKIGRKLLTWERPRFAPIGGIHSIVLYEDPRSEMPIEVDFFMASESGSKPYESVINGTWKGEELPWESGEDDPSREASLSYCALVALWAAKYSSRGADDRIEWALRRYREARERHADLPEIDLTPDSVLALDTIAKSLMSLAKNNLHVVACDRIRTAIAIADLMRRGELYSFTGAA